MKAKRRHELRENILAGYLTQAKDLLGKYGNWLIGIVAAVVIIVLVIYTQVNKGQRILAEEKQRLEQSAGAFSAISGELKPEDKKRLDDLTDLARTAKNEMVAAEAAVAAGDLYSQLSINALVANKNGEEFAKKAKEMYDLALTHPKAKRSVAAAHLGLGVLLENAGDIKAAKAEYDELGKLLPMSDPLSAEASGRSNNLANWALPVKFATTMPSTAPTTRTSTRPVTFVPTTGPVTFVPAGRALPTSTPAGN
jgi:hypothetical protein